MAALAAQGERGPTTACAIATLCQSNCDGERPRRWNLGRRAARCRSSSRHVTCRRASAASNKNGTTAHRHSMGGCNRLHFVVGDQLCMAENSAAEAKRSGRARRTGVNHPFGSPAADWLAPVGPWLCVPVLRLVCLYRG
jgi:hypothetical protein